MPNRTISRVVTTVCFTEDIYDRLERIRDMKFMSRSRYIQEAVKEAIDRDEAAITREEKKQ